MNCGCFHFTLQQSESLLARDVVGGPRDMARSPISALLPHHSEPHARATEGLPGTAWRKAGAYHFMVGSRRVCGEGIAGDHMVQGVSLECSCSG